MSRSNNSDCTYILAILPIYSFTSTNKIQNTMKCPKCKQRLSIVLDILIIRLVRKYNHRSISCEINELVN